MTRTDVRVADRTLEAAVWDGAPDRAALVLLHEGLGSVGLWRAFPAALAAATGRRVVAYSRLDHGRSDRAPGPRRTAAFYGFEARVVLPAVLAQLEVEAPVLVGHSDGAAIALVHAGEHPVAAVVLMAPHVLVEPDTVAAIGVTARAYAQEGLGERLARHHDHVDAMFGAWRDLWTDPAFAGWSLEVEAARLRVPTLLLRGAGDQYTSGAHVERIAAAMHRAGAGACVERVELDARHSPHLEAPEATVDAIVRFLAKLHT